MNFDYLKEIPELGKLYKFCSEAEEFVRYNPDISASSSRKALEFITRYIYAAVVGDTETRYSIFEMLTDLRFVSYVDDEVLMNSFHYIRKMGNGATHDGGLTEAESLKILEELHFLAGEFCILTGLINDYPEFDISRISENRSCSKADEEKHIKDIKADTVEVEPELAAVFAPRMRNVKFDVRYKRDEEENKKLFMLACLRESGWGVVNTDGQSLPCSAGINMILDDGDKVDYVLYGRDNKPLAVIEYTTTVNNLIEGRVKGMEKANKLAKKYGYKPIVYYTNGYQIYIVDQLGYSPRRVFQFHTIEELELLILRAKIRQDISCPVIDENITNRDYQKKAVAAACNAFKSNRRHSLLVMATGTGKTRISISVVDILLKANWVKNVLFMADRTSLVRQAHKNFTKLLPSVTTSVYTGGSMQRDGNARIIFSTYQTMINLIDDDTREFSVGRFDLIVIDEAHRSIFTKYNALFHYFDALMLGLTATPRAEDNKSTYELFKLENGKPDFAYELPTAIKEKYLVGFSVFDKTTDALRRGIHYDELSPEEKEKFEDTFATGDGCSLSGMVVDAKVLKNSMLRKGAASIINIGTIDAMLGDLMKNALKIDGGDKIGKTIIFAKNHLEAEKIVERFQNLYSHLGPDFCKLIDSQVENCLGLIDNFGERDQLPQVAVSVDMMDTGIDAPDVLNLVFFKKVNSKIKFLQMIGRGTRLSPDVFGPGLDKKGFYVFDYFDNFNYFNTNNTWTTANELSNSRGTPLATPQSELINRLKLSVLQTLDEYNGLNEFDRNYRDELRDYFINTTRSLCNDDVEVQYHMAYVSKYRTAEEWNMLNTRKKNEIESHILPLFPSESAPVKVKTFDLLIYAIESEVPKRAVLDKDIRKIRVGFFNVGNKIDSMMNELLKIKTIPAILKKEQLIRSMFHAEYLFENFSLKKCEDVRKQLRDLMVYIPDDRQYYVLDVSDFVLDANGSREMIPTEQPYEKKVESFIEKGHTSLAKIRNLDVLSTAEKDELESLMKSRFGTEKDYIALAGNIPVLQYLRIQVGISDDAVNTKFGSFLNEQVLEKGQIAYMKQIISYVRENGDMTFMDLQRVSPFCDIDVTALFGANLKYIKTLIKGLQDPIRPENGKN